MKKKARSRAELKACQQQENHISYGFFLLKFLAFKILARHV